jgi:ABC-type ATPase involved in cell division
MFQRDTGNLQFQLAADFINQTCQPVFLTGKAGTGKTTFLKYIKENSIKNTVIVGANWVAAINAGGTHHHSFFQLPFGPFLPTQT